jgi:hypothetical protein
MWKSMHHDQIKLWNPITKLIHSNNYISNFLITSSYSPMGDSKSLVGCAMWIFINMTNQDFPSHGYFHPRLK